MKAPPRLAAHLLFVGLLAGGAALLILAGPAPHLLFASDVVAYLDACQRSTLGQCLGRDFTAPLGPAAFLPTILGMRLVGPNVNALALGSAITWSVFGAVAWLIARSRLSPLLSMGFALFVAGTAAASYPLDFGNWRVLSYGLLYNRLAWAALCAVILGTLVPRIDGSRARAIAVMLGACAVWLWALKPNYLLVLAPLILHDATKSERFQTWLWRAALGGGAMGFLLAVCVPFSPTAYVATHLGMAGEAPPAFLFESLQRTFNANFWVVAWLIVVWAGIWATSTRKSSNRQIVPLVAAVIALTIATNIANCQYAEIPVWGALAWVAGGVAEAASQRVRWIFIGALTLALAVMWQPLASLPYTFYWKQVRASGNLQVAEISAFPWRGLPLRAIPGSIPDPYGPLESAANYALWLNDGLALIARHQVTGAVLCLDWNNPFPFALSSAPIIGDEIAWHVGRTVGTGFHPEAAGLSEAAAFVMEPRRSVQPDSLDFKRELFRPFLDRSFVVAAESPHWRLWVRRTDLSP